MIKRYLMPVACIVACGSCVSIKLGGDMRNIRDIAVKDKSDSVGNDGEDQHGQANHEMLAGDDAQISLVSNKLFAFAWVLFFAVGLARSTMRLLLCLLVGLSGSHGVPALSKCGMLHWLYHMPPGDSLFETEDGDPHTQLAHAKGDLSCVMKASICGMIFTFIGLFAPLLWPKVSRYVTEVFALGIPQVGSESDAVSSGFVLLIDGDGDFEYRDDESTSSANDVDSNESHADSHFQQWNDNEGDESDGHAALASLADEYVEKWRSANVEQFQSQ